LKHTDNKENTDSTFILTYRKIPVSLAKRLEIGLENY